MVRHSTAAIAALAILAACGEQPATDSANQAAAPLEVQPLPPAESDFDANLQDVNGTQVANGALAAAPADEPIPAALHGRWGRMPGDCTSSSGEAKGLITIGRESIRFLESVAKPANVRSRSRSRIEGDFAFSGEGQTWTSPMTWSVSGNKLTRLDSEADSKLVYTRCS